MSNRKRMIWPCVAAALALALCTGCEGESDDEPATDASPVDVGAADGSGGMGGTPADSGPGGMGGAPADSGAGGDDCADGTGEGLDPTVFRADGLASPIVEVDCTLDDGTETTCYQIEIIGEPVDHEVGPFCPRNIDDGPEAAGIWIENGEVWDVDGQFITGLAEFYNDDNWLLYDPATGAVNVTTTQEACEAAARPDVDPEYQNHCVECSLDYLDGGVATTLLIPKTPVARQAPAELGRIDELGIALNGVAFAPPAPVDAILGAYTIAAFDDCGGHVNPFAGYHYHAATGCSAEGVQCDDHARLIGYALDGYGIYAMAGDDGVEPDDLDACRGHIDAVRGYHYHAASPGENMFIGCFNGHTAAADGGGGPPDDGGPPGNEPMACPDEPGASRCCGDGVCDGPETSDNCAEDC